MRLKLMNLIKSCLFAGIVGWAATHAQAQVVSPDVGAYPEASTCNSCNNACADDCALFGFIQPSDTCYSDFISPMTNPVFFEDPRNLTEVRFIFLHHELPAALGRTDADLIAAQIRVAITDRLSIIATKDGFIMYDAAGPGDDGWADVAAGLKYLLYGDPDTQTLVSAGLTYEMPVGSTRALQGNGDGEFNLFLTAGKQLGCHWHYVTAAGLRLPSDRQTENQSMYWSHHLDRKLQNNWYAFTEFNYYHYMSEGNGIVIPGINGIDLYNFGSTGLDDVLTWAFGTKKKFGSYHEFGVAYEIPVTDNKDLLENRFTADLILRY
jgi:hypothetical protein